MMDTSTIAQDAPALLQEDEAKWVVEREADFGRFLEAICALGGRPGEPRSLSITDRYLDSAERYLAQARCRCRLRCEDGRWYLSFKETSDPTQEVFSRRERNVELSGVVDAVEAIRYCQANLFAQVRDGLEVNELFALHNRRETRHLRLPGGLEVESSFDRVRMVRGDQAGEMLELELEFVAGDPADFIALVATLTARTGLTPQATSKYDRAAALFGIEERLPEAPSYRFGHSSSLAEAAFQIVRTELETIRCSEPAVRVGVYSDAIHDMRVACRKIRAAARSFKGLYPPAAAAPFGEVTWLGRTLGVGRDLEVHTACLRDVVLSLSSADQELLAPFCASLEARFEMERGEILEMLDSPRYRQMLADIGQLRPDSQASHDTTPVAQIAPRLIRERLERVIEKAPAPVSADTSDDDLHQLRIRLKRVRYLSEFFQHVAPPEIAALLANTKAVQKLLGLHQDYRVGREIIDAQLALERDAGVTAALYRLQQQVDLYKQQLRDAFIEAWPGYCAEPFAMAEETP